MSSSISDLPIAVLAAFRQGVVIPAHPLALDANRRLDQRRQRALTRYYLDAGAGGLAVGVHSTQFAIREVGLYEPVLRVAAETATDWSERPVFRVAGLCGPTTQARSEAQIAASLGYHAGMVSLGQLKNASEDELIEHCEALARVMPLMGFYLQPAAGGIVLSRSFWRRFAELENIVGIKIAPFNRYHTLDVVHGVVAAGAEQRITLYTGNDDHILLDLLSPLVVMRDGEPVALRIKGGLLGHWSVWTARAVELLDQAHTAVSGGVAAVELLALDSRITDCNGVLFDAVNGYRGCIPGCHEVLRRQGLLEGVWCLDPQECLSPGQATEIDRLYRDYPELNDDAFVAANLERWLD